MKLHQILKTLTCIGIVMATGCKPKESKLLLPVFGEKKLVNGDTAYHHIQAFSLVNQYGETVTNSTVSGKIYVADFFFATCQSICPVMSKNLSTVQSRFEKTIHC